jgi:hypothetical protein
MVVRADPPRRAGRGRRPAAHASLPGCHQPDQTCVHLDATGVPEALTRGGVRNEPAPSASPPPPAVAAEHQDGHAGHAARQQVDDLEQHSASQPSPRPPAGNSAGQPMQSSTRAAQHGRGGPGRHPGRSLIRPDFLPRLPDSPPGNLKRLARRLQLVHATPPRELLVDRTNTATNGPAPSLRPHYKSLSATTSRSASASRDGTQPLTASAPLGDLPLTRPRQRTGQYRDTPSPVPRGSRRPGSRRLHAGHRLASKRTPARLIPR